MVDVRDAVISEPVRTAIGRYGGMLKSLDAVELGVAVLNGLLERTGIAPDAVEDGILGHLYPSMEAPAIGRVVALDAGLPLTVPGMQVDRRCSSGQNDAAATWVVTTAEKAAELGLTPFVRLLSWGVAGVPPRALRIGPVPATEAALRSAGLTLADVDLIELNEAFAAHTLAVLREWRFTASDLDRTKVHGSGIALGPPVGATGGRMLATPAREMRRRDARYGLETMCIGGGQGLAAAFERVAA